MQRLMHVYAFITIHCIMTDCILAAFSYIAFNNIYSAFYTCCILLLMMMGREIRNAPKSM